MIVAFPGHTHLLLVITVELVKNEILTHLAYRANGNKL